MKQAQLLNFTAVATAVSLVSNVHADEQTYQGHVGRTLADSKEWWPDPVKVPPGVTTLWRPSRLPGAFARANDVRIGAMAPPATVMTLDG